MIRNKRFDNQIGEEYDFFGLACPHHDDIQSGAAFILKEHLVGLENPKVIEIGFGTGITTRAILESNPNIKLFGVDNVESMLQKAETKVKDLGIERFQFSIADALDFLRGFETASMDAVVSVWVLHNLERNHRQEILKEIYRVLKSGGIFINGDKIADSNPAKHQKDLEWQLKQFDVFETIGKPELKKEWVEHYKEDEKEERIIIEDQFGKELIAIGFKDFNIFIKKYMDQVISAKR